LKRIPRADAIECRPDDAGVVDERLAAECHLVMSIAMLHVLREPIRDRRGSVSLYVALLAPVLAMAVGLGAEVSSWSAAQVDAQRIADVAATAGALSCKSLSSTTNTCSTNAGAKIAATAAANLAQINGASGTANPSWSNPTLTDNQITVQITNGVRNSSDTAVQVSVQKTVPLTISRLVSNQSSVTVQSTSTAELLQTAGSGGSGPQPCMVALQSSAQGGTGVTASGSIQLNMSGCSVVSNAGSVSGNTAGFNDSGGSTLTLSGIYAVGTIVVPCWADLNGNSSNCPVWPANGLIPTPSTYLYSGSSPLTDPYASNSALQTALTNASSASGSAISCSNQNCGLPASTGSTFNGSYCSGQGTGSVYCYLKPGNYGGWAVTSGGPYYFCMAPGLYVFNGNINLTQNTTTADRTTTINGTSITCPSSDTGGVTIITSGTFNGSNTFNFSVSAPSSTQASNTGGYAGVVLAGLTSSSSGFTMSGNPQLWVTGAIYFPNATFTSGGSTGLGQSSTSCLEIIAGSISLSGSSYLSSSCSGVSAQTFYSQPGTATYTATLVR
jgi:Flp pilus assembly protein TadG